LVRQELGRRWKVLPADARARFEALGERNQARYLAEKQSYDANLPACEGEASRLLDTLVSQRRAAAIDVVEAAARAKHVSGREERLRIAKAEASRATARAEEVSSVVRNAAAAAAAIEAALHAAEDLSASETEDSPSDDGESSGDDGVPLVPWANVFGGGRGADPGLAARPGHVLAPRRGGVSVSAAADAAAAAARSAQDRANRARAAYLRQRNEAYGGQVIIGQMGVKPRHVHVVKSKDDETNNKRHRKVQDSYDHIRVRVGAAKKRFDITQKDLAVKMNISYSYLSYFMGSKLMSFCNVETNDSYANSLRDWLKGVGMWEPE
jgi:hypothetical protein